MRTIAAAALSALMSVPAWASSLEDLAAYEETGVPYDEYEQVETYDLKIIRIYRGRDTGTRIICIDDMVRKEPFADNLAGTWDNDKRKVKFIEKSIEDGCWYYKIIPQE